MEDVEVKKVSNYSESGEASILEWTLEGSFKTAEQRNTFIKSLLDRHDFKGMNIQIQGEEENRYGFVIIEHSWADNLKTVAELLEKVDFDL